MTHHETDAATICVLAVSDDAQVHDRAAQLARRFDLKYAVDRNALPPGAPAVVMTEERAEWRDDPDDPRSAVAVDFEQFVVRRGAGLTRRQPLARALGRSVCTVIDATAGMGQDAFLLACFGYEVTAIERVAPLALLLADAVERASLDDRLRGAMGDRLRVVHADAAPYLASLESPPDAVYVDPMFPPKRKASALPPKPVQMLRRLVGDDADAAELLAIARQTARQRVVVKRPTHAKPLAPSPDASHEGKLVRYDVYAIRP